MPRQRKLDILFPMGGLNRRAPFRHQPPYSTFDCLNVRPFSGIDGRQRGGSRPGITRSHDLDIGDEVRLLDTMTLALGDGFAYWIDTFDGDELSDAWETAPWAANSPSVLPAYGSSLVDRDITSGAAIRTDALPIDSDSPYSVEIYIIPWEGAHNGTFQIYAGLDDTTPAIGTDGLTAEITMVGTSGAWTGNLFETIAGVTTVHAFTPGSDPGPAGGWFSILIDGTSAKCFWNGTELVDATISATAGVGVGFGIDCSEDNGVAIVDGFNAQFFSTSPVSANRTLVVASASGNFYRERFYGELEQVTTDVLLNDQLQLQSAQSGQKLYIADYSSAISDGIGAVSATDLSSLGVDWTTIGLDADTHVVVILNPQGTVVAGTYRIASFDATNITLTEAIGTGACTYRVERAAKVYDPLSDTLAVMEATEGQVPAGQPLIARYLDRIVLAGGEIAPQVWYMSRQGDPLDWDYGADDVQRAVAGTASEAGVPGEPITALIAHSDDYLIMAGRGSMWRLTGDPAYGGILNNVSHTVGIIDKHAFCLGPLGEIIFLSTDGLYVLSPGAGAFPQQVSREILPDELINIDINTVTVSLEYEVEGRGVHIYLTPNDANASATHWWFDWTTSTFWPVSLSTVHDPFVTTRVPGAAANGAGVIMGCRDGVLRRYRRTVPTDEGLELLSYVEIGPLPLGNDLQIGKLMKLRCNMAKESSPVAWTMRSADSYEGVKYAENGDEGEFVGGVNTVRRPGARGQAMSLRIDSIDSGIWSIDSMTGLAHYGGRQP